MDYIGIGKRVQELRKHRGYTQEALAEAADLSAPYLSHIERAVKKASLESLVRIAEALDISVEWLLNGISTISVNSTFHEAQDLFKDCSAQEQRILFETAKAIKEILRDSSGLHEK